MIRAAAIMNARKLFSLFVIVLALGGLYLARSVYRSVRRGDIWLMGRTLKRTEGPGVFWTLVAIRGTGAFLMVAFGILGLVSFLQH